MRARAIANVTSSAATRPLAAWRKSPSTTSARRRCASSSARQPREVGGGRAARQRDAAGAERRRLAEVHVGDEQRALARPVQRALGEQLDGSPASANGSMSTRERRQREMRRRRGAAAEDACMRDAGSACEHSRRALRGTKAAARTAASAFYRPRRASRCRAFRRTSSFLFTEVPFLERFGEAAHAGFRAVEFAFPYDVQAKDIAAVRGTPQARDRAVQRAAAATGRPAIAASRRSPDREHEFAAGFVTALRYAQALRCRRLHVMAGVAARGRRRRARATPPHLHAQPALRVPGSATRTASTILIEPLNPRDMPDYFLTTQADAHAIREEVGAAEPQGADGPLPRADRRGRPEREAAPLDAAHRPHPDRRRAGTPRARRRRGQLRATCSG